MSQLLNFPALPVCLPLARRSTSDGLSITLYAIPLDQVPVDFFADPDGQWTFEALASAAGFQVNEGVAIGALRHSFNEHPEGAAVVTLNRESRPYVAIIECPIAYACVAEAATERASAA